MNEASVPRFVAVFTVLAGLLVALGASVAVAEDFVGGPGNNNISGTNGDDFIRGLGGNDNLNGRLGDDRIYGGDGNDTVIGQPGNDVLNGGTGDDEITNNEGRDEAFGAGGNDTIVATNDTQRDFVDCGPGNDDVAKVQANDFVDDSQASLITVETTGLSCETIVVNGVLIIGAP